MKAAQPSSSAPAAAGGAACAAPAAAVLADGGGFCMPKHLLSTVQAYIWAGFESFRMLAVPLRARHRSTIAFVSKPCTFRDIVVERTLTASKLKRSKSCTGGCCLAAGAGAAAALEAGLLCAEPEVEGPGPGVIAAGFPAASLCAEAPG